MVSGGGASVYRDLQRQYVPTVVAGMDGIMLLVFHR